MSDQTFQAPSPEHLKELLPQYGIEHYIDQGSIGAVYKGRQLSLDRDVAIKILFHEFGDNPESRESFITEARAMARLKHPNILGVFDFGDIDGMPYTVMEYVHGESLHDAAWNQVIDPSQAAGIVIGICKGLACAHDQNIFHRDLRLRNILLTVDAVPKVSDFVLTSHADSKKSGTAKGTLGYTAPEVLEDPEQAGKLGDIYSVGVILHQLLTGIDPIGSTGPPTQPTGMLRLDAIWRKATHTSPSQRYPSVNALAADLEKWMATHQEPKKTPAGANSYNPTKPKIQVAQLGNKKMAVSIGATPYKPTNPKIHVAQQGQQKAKISLGAKPIKTTSLKPEAALTMQKTTPISIGAAPAKPANPKLDDAQPDKQSSPISLGAAPGKTTSLKNLAEPQGKQMAAAPNAAAPHNPANPKPPAATQLSDNGTGIIFKLIIIVILTILVVFTYKILQHRKESIQQGFPNTRSLSGSGTVDSTQRSDK